MSFFTKIVGFSENHSLPYELVHGCLVNLPGSANAVYTIQQDAS